MTIEISNSMLNDGKTGSAFDNNGGILRLNKVDTSAVMAVSLVATANTGASFLQDSTVSNSVMTSVTHTTASGSQTVMNVDVSKMDMIDKAFYVEGERSMLSISNAQITQNTQEKPWMAVSVHMRGLATIMDTTISNNAGLQSGVSASVGGAATIANTVFEGNKGTEGRSKGPSSLILALSDAKIQVDESQFRNNAEYSVSTSRK